ncbi:MAG: hypothetical protein QW035_01075 [Candidatus Anstonellales archaeon]
MALLKGFSAFIESVMGAVKGRLEPAEEQRLKRLLERIGRKNKVIASGLVRALKEGGASKEDLKKVLILLERADHRIMNDAEPFMANEEREFKEILEKATLPPNVFYKIKFGLDEMVKYEIVDLLAKEVSGISMEAEEKVVSLGKETEVERTQAKEEEKKDRKTINP